MRAFSTILIAAVFALSANAAAVEKRAVSAAVTLCMADLDAVAAQLALVKADVDVFTSASGYAGAIAIHNKEAELETRITKATTDCCAIAVPANAEDTVALLANVGTLVPKVTGALSSIVSKKSQFAAIILATTIVKADIKSLDTKNTALNVCLVAKVPATPAEYLVTANAYVAAINAGFATAKTTYGV